jgi:uncharacterized membrane protein YbhN (UPF0104 family)
MLFAGIILVFYWQLSKMNFSVESVELKFPLLFLLAFLLVPLNWFCEWQKWRITLKAAEVRSTNRLAFNAFLAGIVSGMLTPNMLGNFIGRIFYFQRRDRIAITVYTMFSNYGQFAASVVVGLICIYFLNETPFGQLPDYFIWLAVPIILFVFILHFYFDFFFSKIFKRRMRALRIPNKNRIFSLFHWKVLFWSLFRLSVFSIQFCLVLVAFGAEFNFILFLWIGQYYFWVTLAPSLFFGKVVIRDSIALWVLVAVIANSATIVVASFSIWIINLLLPTLFSVLFFRSKKVIV